MRRRKTFNGSSKARLQLPDALEAERAQQVVKKLPACCEVASLLLALGCEIYFRKIGTR